MKVGWCARTISSAVAPFAIATKMGWFAQAGIKVELVPLPGSTDCVKTVATRDVQYSLPSIEPLAIIRPQGVKAKNYLHCLSGQHLRHRRPGRQPGQSFTDLKGKKIGVTSMASAGVIVARALATTNGMDPDRDITVVVAGEAAQTAALLRSNQVDALSQFDTQYALAENAGAKLRMLEDRAIAKFPSNGLIALDETLKNNRAEAVALGQGYAKGTLFAITNPEAAHPHPLGGVPADARRPASDDATALRDDIKTLEARMQELEARGRRGDEVGRELGSELPGLPRLPAEERRPEAARRRPPTSSPTS